MAPRPLFEEGGKMAGWKLNTGLNPHLEGSSLVEAVTASVLFLILFSIAMQALVGMTSHQVEARCFVAAEQDYRTELQAVLQGEYSSGKHLKKFAWGTLEMVLEPYGTVIGLYRITVAIQPEGNRGNLIRRHVVKLHKRKDL